MSRSSKHLLPKWTSLELETCKGSHRMWTLLCVEHIPNHTFSH